MIFFRCYKVVTSFFDFKPAVIFFGTDVVSPRADLPPCQLAGPQLAHPSVVCESADPPTYRRRARANKCKARPHHIRLCRLWLEICPVYLPACDGK